MAVAVKGIGVGGGGRRKNRDGTEGGGGDLPVEVVAVWSSSELAKGLLVWMRRWLLVRGWSLSSKGTRYDSVWGLSALDLSGRSLL